MDNNPDLFWTDEFYQKALNFLDTVFEKNPLLCLEDSTDIGNKYTYCNVGLCSRPIKNMADGTYRKGHHKCPFDDRHNGETGTQRMSGCFWMCLLFQGKIRTGKDARKHYLKWRSGK